MNSDSIAVKMTKTLLLTIFCAQTLNSLAKPGSSDTAEPIDNRVINGYICAPNEIPYIVYLDIVSVESDSTTTTSVCGGSLLTPVWILTAAHCPDPQKFPKRQQIRAKIGSPNYQLSKFVSNIVEIHIYPDYSSKTLVNDIAVLRMGKAPPSNMILSYPKLVSSKGETDLCDEALSAGWGMMKEDDSDSFPDVLRCAKFKIIMLESCSFGPLITEISDSLDGTRIYAMVGKDSVDTCSGDSGGPVICVATGRLIGLVSAGEGCGDAGHCSLYTKIESYFKFIKEKTGLDLPEWEPTDDVYSKRRFRKGMESEDANKSKGEVLVVSRMLIVGVFMLWVLHQ